MENRLFLTPWLKHASPFWVNPLEVLFTYSPSNLKGPFAHPTAKQALSFGRKSFIDPPGNFLNPQIRRRPQGLDGL